MRVLILKMLKNIRQSKNKETYIGTERTLSNRSSLGKARFNEEGKISIWIYLTIF